MSKEACNKGFITPFPRPNKTYVAKQNSRAADLTLFIMHVITLRQQAALILE
uniref:Uncharacterized protein n=1 Tax=Arundo donax TaxID=35708 RepID=A0A0A8YRI4_ARUDO